ncbi:MAG: single-stranded DNA-binding protein [bacterium]
MNMNKVMLIGRLGKDPEVRYTNSGSAVANFSVATTDTWKDKSGQKQERTEWHNVVVWARLADFAQNYLKKGKLIYLEGRLQTRDWTDNQNVRHWKTEIVANTINFMEKLSDSPGGGAPRDAGSYQAPPPEAAQQPDPGQEPAPAPEPGPGQDPGPQEPPPENAYVEDDIPF